MTTTFPPAAPPEGLAADRRRVRRVLTLVHRALSRYAARGAALQDGYLESELEEAYQTVQSGDWVRLSRDPRLPGLLDAALAPAVAERDPLAVELCHVVRYLSRFARGSADDPGEAGIRTPAAPWLGRPEDN